MKLFYLELDFNEYTIYLTFDRFESMTIDENLQVCTSETVRGKNKTFNAYVKPKNITLSGKFNDIVGTNLELRYIEKVAKSNSINPHKKYYVWEEVSKINTLAGKDKASKLNHLFESLIEDTRLLNVKTFYKTYENFVLTGFDLVYTNNNTISVTLNLQEMLLEGLNEYNVETLTYAMIEEANRKAYEQTISNIKKIVSKVIDFLFNLSDYVFKKSTDEVKDQGGTYVSGE